MANILENKRKTDIRAYKRHLRVLIPLKKSKSIKRFCKTRFKRKLGLRDFSSVTEESLKSGFDCILNILSWNVQINGAKQRLGNDK